MAQRTGERPEGDAPRVFELRFGQERLVVLSMPSVPVLPDPSLTAAENEVASDVLRGLSNAEIAQRRRRSPRTIANQLASIYRKLGLSSRSELAAALGQQHRPRR